MKRELEQQLVKDFPLCFGDYGKDPKESCMAFGCECGDGWYGILREACEKSEPIIARWLAEHKNDADYKEWAPRFSQVKEKFGTLRIYFTTYPQDQDSMNLDDIEEDAEEKSSVTCESCGKPGKLRGQGWYYTSCLLCARDEDKDNLEIVEEALIRKEKENE
jgi:hypothetical protein